MSNGIAARQNEERNIACLAAQRKLYSDVGYTDVIDLIVSAVVPIGLTITQNVLPDNMVIKLSSCFFSLFVLGISFLLNSFINKKKVLAASIQQDFDVEVFKMPWDERLFGKRKNLSREITSASKKILANQKLKESLINWYTPSVDELPIIKAIAECQRENYSWDVNLRKRYRTGNTIILLLVFVGPLLICSIKGLMVNDLIIKYVVFLPIIKWTSMNIKKLNNDLVRMKSIDILVNHMSKTKMEDLQFTQKELFEHRRQAVKIPNFFYRVFRKNDEERERRATDFR